MAEKIYLYPVWLRIWHAINGLLFLALIATGISMQYSSPDAPLIRFDLAVRFHNIAGVIVSINYLIFVVGNLATGNGRYYRILFEGYLKRVSQQIDYYLCGYFKGGYPPFPVNAERKFNPLQQGTYVGTMYLLMPLIIITGLALLFPETIADRIGNFSGIYLTALLHAAVGFLLSLFLIVHVYFATMGATPLSNFRGIIKGWHETH